MPVNREPIIIQGGMGVAVSGWRLARAVSETGQLGVVSGTALDTVMLRRLQLGDRGGHVRRAMAEFPYQEMTERILRRYFIPGGKTLNTPFATSPLHSLQLSPFQLQLIAVANFVEVFLAKERHDGLVGINYLEKIQLPTLPSLYGAMLAGVDYVFMGAGIPQAIPGILDELCEGKPVELPVKVVGAKADDSFATRFAPEDLTRGEVPWLVRPKFVPIIASSTLATMLARKSNGRVDGFVVEGPTAGGHNAPPRGQMKVNRQGEPIYGERDIVSIESIRELGLPFWLAGSYGSPERLAEAQLVGATGIQVGTAFAYCQESGMSEEIKRRVLKLAVDDRLELHTDPLASPTGFPFKVLRLENSLTDLDTYASRSRRCDLGYLRQGYRKANGEIGWRCPAEDEETYAKKGGDQKETVGRKCLCNALVANVGLGQCHRDGTSERPLVTSGDEAKNLGQFLKPGELTYTAGQVIDYLLTSVRSDQCVAK